MRPEDGRLKRPQDPLEYEREFWGRGLFRVAGIDEVGRGPLAGPVVAAAVVLPPELAIVGARDSKKLSPHKRETLCAEILCSSATVSIGAASVREIDRINILNATTLAMRRAISGLSVPPEHLVVDGRPVRNLGWEHSAVVGGDDRVHSIACASIVAKVVRDRLMKRLATRYPGYGWERNKGYGTAEHLMALDRLGITPHHRRSFRPMQTELNLS